MYFINIYLIVYLKYMFDHNPDKKTKGLWNSILSRENLGVFCFAGLSITLCSMCFSISATTYVRSPSTGACH